MKACHKEQSGLIKKRGINKEQLLAAKEKVCK